MNNSYKQLKAILFDLVGVLVFIKKGYVPTSLDEINASNIEKLFNHLDDKKLLVDIKFNLHLTDKEINRALPYIPAKFELYQPLWDLLPDLKQKYHLAIINNGNAVALNHWKTIFNFSIFELFINSAEVGIKKPDPKIFLNTCQRLGVKPEECLYMDDSIENIESAKSLGMQVIWWNKEKSKEDNLQELKKFILPL